jgi:hypothetical protein
VIRERIGRAMLRVYSDDVRAARGEEMLGTLLEAGEASARAFARESGSILLAGLRERAMLVARTGSRRLIADAYCQAAPIWLLFGAANFAAAEQRRPWAANADVLSLIVLGALLLAALVGYDRIVGVTGMSLIVGLGLVIEPHAATRVLTLAILLVPLACCVVMAFAPRKGPPNPRRLVLLVPAVALVLLLPEAVVRGTALLVLVSLLGVIRLPIDPRLAIACAIVWSGLGLSDVAVALSRADASSGWILATAASLVMFTIATTRLHYMQRKHQT